MTTLAKLQPGARFSHHGQSGTLILVNACRARVKLDGAPREVTLTDRHGQERSFVAEGAMCRDWSPGTLVEVEG